MVVALEGGKVDAAIEAAALLCELFLMECGNAKMKPCMWGQSVHGEVLLVYWSKSHQGARSVHPAGHDAMYSSRRGPPPPPYSPGSCLPPLGLPEG